MTTERNDLPTEVRPCTLTLESPASATAWRRRILVQDGDGDSTRITGHKTVVQLAHIPVSTKARARRSSVLGEHLLSDACAGEGIDDSTTNYPLLRDVSSACVNLKGVNGGSGHIGVDPVLGGYSPGNNHLDPFYGACVMSNVGCNSYYSVHGFWNGGHSFPYGMFIENADRNHCTDKPWCRGSETLAHNWANRITQVHLEVYSYGERYGGASLWADFSHIDPSNNVFYTVDLGTINLPDGDDQNPDGSGRYNVAKLNGFVYGPDGSTPVSSGRVTFHMWGSTDAKTTTGVPLGGFASVNTNADGYYNSKWVYPGDYYCMLIDNRTGRVREFDASIRRPFERLDFTLDA